MSLKVCLKFLAILLLCEQINVINGVSSDGFGFNIYKDFLRSKNNDNGYDVLAELINDKLFAKNYFYQRPFLTIPKPFDDNYIKRSSNTFKNMMLNKDGPSPVNEGTIEKQKPVTNFYIPRAMSKRGPLWLKTFNLQKEHEIEEKEAGQNFLM